jgi:hypothetical protein
MVVLWLRPLTVKYRPTATRLILAEHPVEHQGHEQGSCAHEQQYDRAIARSGSETGSRRIVRPWKALRTELLPV